MCSIDALKGLKRHAGTPFSDVFPVLGAHMSFAEFQYPDLIWKEMCGLMANLVAKSGGNKGQLSLLVEAICHNFDQRDPL